MTQTQEKDDEIKYLMNARLEQGCAVTDIKIVVGGFNAIKSLSEPSSISSSMPRIPTTKYNGLISQQQRNMISKKRRTRLAIL